MASSTFEWLVGLLEPLLDCPGGGPRHLPAASRLALGLSHLYTGASYAELAARFGVPEAAAHSCARRLRRVLCTNFHFCFAFPSHAADIRAVSVGFESLPPDGGLPGCCGAVACACFGVGGGVSAKLLADASCRILSIDVGFRGDQLDSRVLKRSSLYRDGETGRLLNSAEQYLVAGAGYPLLTWLMVPFKGVATDASQGDFNTLHKLMLRPVLRTISSLRNWRVLSSPMEGEEDDDGRTVVACVATCAILHIVLLMREDYSALAVEVEV
ncbi:hypothetical protein Taro_028633 [Colocasia esculenta]|uniref:DDE Tnp4 domain-containing protein n=1 Tax=Colocasia esculenta TaxID=4460 RepID=A0A843VHR8_COLES|nr:hypothetical protein [Colocasia esculenta]